MPRSRSVLFNRFLMHARSKGFTLENMGNRFRLYSLVGISYHRALQLEMSHLEGTGRTEEDVFRDAVRNLQKNFSEKKTMVTFPSFRVKKVLPSRVKQLAPSLYNKRVRKRKAKGV